MDRISLEPITRELCHRFYKGFENDPAIYMDMGTFKTYIYDVKKLISISRVKYRRTVLYS